MTEKLAMLLNRTSRLTRKESGAVSFEYALILGGVSAVVMVILVAVDPTLVDTVINGACNAIGDVLGNPASCLD